MMGGKRKTRGSRKARKGGVAETEEQCAAEGGMWRNGVCEPTIGGRHRKGHKTRKGRKMRGGVMYGPTQAITAGALQWGAVDTSAPVDSATGAKVADPFGTSPDTNAKVTGGRRRSRASRKGKSKKSKKTARRSRKLRGGAWSPGNVNAAGVRYGFEGPTEGVRGGIAPATAAPSRVGGAPMGADGVRSA